MPTNVPILPQNSASIFARDPAGANVLLAWSLAGVVLPLPQRVRLDLTHSVGVSRRRTVARNPLERFVANNSVRQPETLTIQGSLSSTPIGPIATPLGAFGSALRRDLKETRKLRALQDRGEPVIVVCVAGLFPSMMITSVQEEHPGSEKVDLSITFEEIEIVSPLTVVGEIDQDALLAASDAETNMGIQPTELVADFGGLGA